MCVVCDMRVKHKALRKKMQVRIKMMGMHAYACAKDINHTIPIKLSVVTSPTIDNIHTQIQLGYAPRKICDRTL